MRVHGKIIGIDVPRPQGNACGIYRAAQPVISAYRFVYIDIGQFASHARNFGEPIDSAHGVTCIPSGKGPQPATALSCYPNIEGILGASQPEMPQDHVCSSPLRVFRRNSPLQRSEQVLTLSQSRAHFLRQAKGLPQAAQVFSGRFDLEWRLSVTGLPESLQHCHGCVAAPLR